MNKIEKLRELIRSYGSCLVAYSGGVDSAFLAYVAHEVLGEKALSVIADTPSLPRHELADAIELGRRFGFPVRVVQTKEFDNPAYLANPLNRCYFCKHELFSVLTAVAQSEGLAVMIHGENASDVGDYRPGQQAAAEFRACAPLKEAGLTKPEIRALSAQFGLPTADKPQMACLSSRVPYGESVTTDKLRMIEEAENVLRMIGFYEVRVRHHELRAPSSGAVADAAKPLDIRNVTFDGVQHLARIEVGVTEMKKLFSDNQMAQQVAEALKKIGYTHVTLDLLGYRRGSANEMLAARLAPHVAGAEPKQET
jgi:pyridinium-3,5-biscarboxylic acid mononucleotide sulfurtransferase